MSNNFEGITNATSTRNNKLTAILSSCLIFCFSGSLTAVSRWILLVVILRCLPRIWTRRATVLLLQGLLIVHIVHNGRGDLLDWALYFRRNRLQRTHTSISRCRRCGRCALRQQRVGKPERVEREREREIYWLDTVFIPKWEPFTHRSCGVRCESFSVLRQPR